MKNNSKIAIAGLGYVGAAIYSNLKNKYTQSVLIYDEKNPYKLIEEAGEEIHQKEFIFYVYQLLR